MLHSLSFTKKPKTREKACFWIFIFCLHILHFVGIFAGGYNSPTAICMVFPAKNCTNYCVCEKGRTAPGDTIQYTATQMIAEYKPLYIPDPATNTVFVEHHYQIHLRYSNALVGYIPSTWRFICNEK